MPRPIYFGPADRSLFGWYGPPAGAIQRGCGVVLCNPIGDDAIRSHRTWRHLAERLSRAGFATLRFDFHGTGDSAGDERQPDRVRSWLEDVSLAVEELRALSGADSIAVVGIRLGGSLAVMAAAESGAVDSLVLWGPHRRGRDHVTEATRRHEVHRMLEPRGFAGGPRSRPDGEEALGFLLTHATMADLAALDLHAAKARPARRALLVSDGGTRAEQEILDILGSLGTAAERQVHPGCQQFLLEIPHRSQVPEDAITATVDWLSDLYPPIEAAPPLPQSGRGGRGVRDEEPVRFGRDGRLFGILHPPHPGAPSNRPPIVVLNAGTVHRIGPHRLYVALARRWAGLGFPVFRVDLSGIGDSPAAPGTVENLTYPRDGLRDAGEAMDWLTERTGARRLVVAGLCSGGDLAFQLGRRDPRVSGVVMMNPRTFCIHDLELVENPASERPRWQRLLDLVHPRSEAQEPVPVSLRRMAERGVDTLLCVGEHDPGVVYVDRCHGEEMRALRACPGFRREDIAGIDHNFTSLWSQERVSDLVTDHLVRRHDP